MAPCWPLFPQHVGKHILVQPLFCWACAVLRLFGRPGPLLAPFGLNLGGSGARFWEVLGSILEVSGDNLGIRLLLEKLVFRSVLLASGSGWAGGVTRSAKNSYIGTLSSCADTLKYLRGVYIAWNLEAKCCWPHVIINFPFQSQHILTEAHTYELACGNSITQKLFLRGRSCKHISIYDQGQASVSVRPGEGSQEF